MPIKWEAGWTTLRVWMLWRRDKSVDVPVLNRTGYTILYLMDIHYVCV
jgi:hypothetical protein